MARAGGYAVRASANTEPGSNTGCTCGGAQRVERLRGRGFKMIRGARAQLGGQSGSGAGAKLLGVQAQLQAVGARCGEHNARFLHREGVVVAEGVAEARELQGGNLGDQLFGDPAHILRAASGKLRRQRVRRQQRGHDAHRALGVEPRHHAQHAQLRLTLQPIA